MVIRHSKTSEKIPRATSPSNESCETFPQKIYVQKNTAGQKELKRAIQASKATLRKKICNALDKNICIIALKYPNILLNAYNASLATGTFSTVWKRRRLVLLDERKGNPVTPSSFRQLCLLDIAGKLLEKLILERLRNNIDHAGGFANNQHGLRKGRPAVGAIRKVIETITEAWAGSLKARKVCFLPTLEIKNAFNSRN